MEPDYAEFREAYLAAWRRMLPALLGWSDEQTAAWSRKWERQMIDEYSLFYHEDPIWYVVPLLIPPGIWSRLRGLERVALERLVHEALAADVTWSSPDADWAAARVRVAQLLDRYVAGGGAPPVL